jgi:hypothetical protein
LSNPQSTPIQRPQPPTPAINKTSVDTVSANAISRLHQTSQRTFGSIEPLNFEFIEEAGQRSAYPLSHQIIILIIAQARNAY